MIEMPGILFPRARRWFGSVWSICTVAALIATGCDKRSSESDPAARSSPEIATSEPTPANPASDPVSEGTALMESGDNAAALKAFTRAVQAAPSDSKPLVMRAFVDMKLGKVRSALADLNRAIEVNPNEGDAYEQRGILLAGGGATPQAIQDFDKAIQLKPLHLKLYINRGLCYQRLKQFAKAEADYNRAHELVPKSGLPFEYRGGLFVEQGKLNAALAQLDEPAASPS